MKNKGRIEGQFVPVLYTTMDSSAWRAMSHGAQMLFVALKRRYNLQSHNNGRLYLSNRMAAKELRSSPNQIVRWFRELQYFGFIVMQKPGGLGIYGNGQAPRWRLTELGYMKDPPTRDFTRWNGVWFHEGKKQKPVTENRNGVLRKTVTVPLRKTVTLHGTTVTENRNKEGGQTVTENRNKSSNHLGGVWVGDNLRGETPPSLTIIEDGKAPPEQCPSRACAHCGCNGEPLFKFKNGSRPVWLHRVCRRHWLAHEAAS